jgi:hypothetical protein
MAWVFWVILALAVIAGIYKAVTARGGQAANARLRGYGVVVDGSEVKSGGRVLGPLAGSQAVVTDPTARQLSPGKTAGSGVGAGPGHARACGSHPEGQAFHAQGQPAMGLASIHRVNADDRFRRGPP